MKFFLLVPIFSALVGREEGPFIRRKVKVKFIKLKNSRNLSIIPIYHNGFFDNLSMLCTFFGIHHVQVKNYPRLCITLFSNKMGIGFF